MDSGRDSSAEVAAYHDQGWDIAIKQISNGSFDMALEAFGAVFAPGADPPTLMFSAVARVALQLAFHNPPSNLRLDHETTHLAPTDLCHDPRRLLGQYH